MALDNLLFRDDRFVAAKASSFELEGRKVVTKLCLSLLIVC